MNGFLGHLVIIGLIGFYGVIFTRAFCEEFFDDDEGDEE